VIAVALLFSFNLAILHRVSKTHALVVQDARDENLSSSASSSVIQSQDQINDIATTSNSPYAYAWVMGGIHEDRPAYRGFLYDVMISANLLRQYGSTADFWLWIQMSPDSKLSTLPSSELEWLNKLGVQVKVLPSPEPGSKESFARLVYDKFRTLEMTDYRRVMFLDADIIPIANMDYLFQLSDEKDTALPTILRPNVIIATRGEPCNTAFFIVEPSLDNYNKLQAAIERQHEEGRKIPYPHFDWRRGWGHNFEEAGDSWQSVHKTGTKWRYHAGHSDQGLMYFYAKYLVQDVSIAIGNKVQNWVASTLPEEMTKEESVRLPTMIYEEENLLEKYSPKPSVYHNSCEKDNAGWSCPPPYQNYAHFAGSKKPWQEGNQRHFMNGDDTFELHAPYRLWFATLEELNTKLAMGLDISKWNELYMEGMKESPLGYMAMYKDNTEKIMEGGTDKQE
jgi:hypothetical protein